jgi:ComF family protein
MFSPASIIRPVLDFVYPPVCFTCDEMLQEPGDMICRKCRASYPKVDKNHVIWNEITERFADRQQVKELVACYLFQTEGTLQAAIHQLKYRGIKSIGEVLGKEVGEKIRAHREMSKADYLVPIPLHKVKQRERGYNQAEYIAAGITAVTGIPVAKDILIRARVTETQTKLNINRRRQNVGDAFQLHPKLSVDLKDKSIILVDDVITTGATMEAAASVLITAKIKAVYAASLALAE